MYCTYDLPLIKSFATAAFSIVLLSADLPAQQFEVLSRIERTYGDKTVCISDDGATVLIVKSLSNGFNAQGMSGDGKHFVGYNYHSSSNISSGLFAYDVSFDGSVVVGQTKNGAVRIANGQTTTLGKLFSDDTISSARAVSADGRTVVGQSYHQESIPYGFRTTRAVPFRWTEESGMVSLGRLPGVTTDGIGFAQDVSADGQ